MCVWCAFGPSQAKPCGQVNCVVYRTQSPYKVDNSLQNTCNGHPLACLSVWLMGEFCQFKWFICFNWHTYAIQDIMFLHFACDILHFRNFDYLLSIGRGVKWVDYLYTVSVMGSFYVIQNKLLNEQSHRVGVSYLWKFNGAIVKFYLRAQCTLPPTIWRICSIFLWSDPAKCAWKL